MKNKIKKVQSISLVTLLTLTLVLSALGPFNIKRAEATPPVGSGTGSIWTTDNGCQIQDVNEYSVGDHVYINGSNFDPNTTYTWQIKGQPGEASSDPNIVVASGNQMTDGAGAVCFDAYTILLGDRGVYTVDFSNKNDNYHVADYCGDGVLNTGEQCDDGNTANGDGCDSTCQTECVSTTELCDGKDNDCDGTVDEGCPFCGDGDVNFTGEQCDGEDMGQAPSEDYFCSVTCHLIPIYESEGTECPRGTVAEKVGETHTIDATDADGIAISIDSNKTYLFRASGTFVPTSPVGWFSDAGYTTTDVWANLATQYGIQGTGNDYAAHALLGDLGNGVGVINWGNYNSNHEYEFNYTIPIEFSPAQFVIGDRYGDWFTTPWQNQSGMNDNNGNLSLDVYECKSECIPEGGSGAVILDGPECCQGLTQIGCDQPDQFGNCSLEPCVGSFYCANCGNGICGLGENKCNCPEDCEEPEVEYCGMYFNQVPDGVEFEGPIGGLVPGDNPFNHPGWWDIAKLAFEQNDSDLTFGNNFLPVDQSLTGDPFHFTAHWRALLNVSADGNYGYTLGSDDDSWMYIDGNMVEDLGGVHAPVTVNDSVYLTAGQHIFNLYFAERHTVQSYLYFEWTTPGIEVIAECEPYCGDGTCDGQESCETCETDCGICPKPECETNEDCDDEDACTTDVCGDGQCVRASVTCFDNNPCTDDSCDPASGCVFTPNDQCVCDPNVELVTNGGFETPEVIHSALWNIFNNSNGLTGWSVEWKSLQDVFQEISRPFAAFLELQKGVAGDPKTGLQLAELDSDWFGPDNPLNGEPASVKIYQDISTITGKNYDISFWFSPRPNTTLDNNRLEFSWNGEVKDTITNGAGENNTTWKEYTYSFAATGNTTRIEFADLGVPSDSLGTYLDDVSVRCNPGEPGCDEQSRNWAELDKANIGNSASELAHAINGWSSANILGNYGGCQNGITCDYRQVLGEGDSCADNQSNREATVILHVGTNTIKNLVIRHLDGISLLDSFDIYINDQLIGTWNDLTQVVSEVWTTTEFDISSYGFTGDITVKLYAKDAVWASCPTYGQVSIDWMSVYGCGDIWQPFCGDGFVNQQSETCELPDTTDNQYCQQSTTQCADGNKTQTRDAFGGCNENCGCVEDSWGEPVCVKDSCNAACAIDADCNDDNENTADTCNLTTCLCENTPHTCGNGILQTGEECDYGAQNGQACSPACGNSCSYCSASCQLVTVQGSLCSLTNGGGGGGGGGRLVACGDGISELGEQCDDGNLIDGDGCSSICKTEEVKGEVLGEATTRLPETGNTLMLSFFALITGMISAVGIKRLRVK